MRFYCGQIIYKQGNIVYNTFMRIILASKSPRRRQLLGELGVDFDIIPAALAEVVEDIPDKAEVARRIALHKAEEISLKYPDCAAIGADTIVVLGNEILQKPKDDEDERRMLDELSGKAHYVYTGYALLMPGKKISGADITKVFFNDLSEEKKAAYVKSGLGLDKAGGYGIQDGYDLVNRIEGSYSNVVGFPQEVFEKLLKENNLI